MSEDPLEDALNASSVSSPDLDLDIGLQEPPQPVKRKGGRKPVYATLEERKQRNRQAQAAFRERRTEYIKQLEIAMKENEEAMDQLQQSNREIIEECHMLRYKTSLLEDLLYENGIDYQSELQSRSTKSLLSSPFAMQGSTRAQWTQQPAPNGQRDKKQRPLQSPQKLKSKGKATNAQTRSPSRAQSAYLLPYGTSHRVDGLPLQHDPVHTGQVAYSHSNGAIHAMHTSMHRLDPHFEDSQVDTSMSHNDQTGPYYSVDTNHMVDFLGPGRFSDASAYQEPRRAQNRHNGLPRPIQGQYRPVQQLVGPSQDHASQLASHRLRSMSTNPSHEMFSRNGSNQSPPMGQEILRAGDLSEELPFAHDAMS